MHWIVLVVVVALVAFFLFSRSKGKHSLPSAEPPKGALSPPLGRDPEPRKGAVALSTFDANKDWLKARWIAIDQRHESGDDSGIPKWYFDEATERQIERIKSEGFELPMPSVSKGQASDIIGLFEPPEESDTEVLKFFKISTKNLNQTMARAEFDRLMADPEKAEAWQKRSADAEQKETLRFYGVPVPRGLTHAAAVKLIDEREDSLREEGSQLPDEWESLSSIISEFADIGTCAAYDIKRPGASVVRAAVDALRKGGKSLKDIDHDIGLVAEKIVEMQPEIKRRS